MPDIQLVGLHDPDLQIAPQRSAAVGNPPIFTDYAQMLDETHPMAGQPYGTGHC